MVLCVEERHESEENRQTCPGSLNCNRHLLSAYFVQDMGAEAENISSPFNFTRALSYIFYLLSADKETERGLKGLSFLHQICWALIEPNLLQHLFLEALLVCTLNHSFLLAAKVGDIFP